MFAERQVCVLVTGIGEEKQIEGSCLDYIILLFEYLFWMKMIIFIKMKFKCEICVASLGDNLKIVSLITFSLKSSSDTLCQPVQGCF